MERVVHEEAGPLKPALYVVATPIGNLADITFRAVATLQGVDVVAAEDTRVTKKLLAHYRVAAPLISLHEHNEPRCTLRILEMLAQGKSVALVSDAGTPAISDPGAYTVAAVRAAGHRVVPVPGANAAMCAVSAAGTELPFLFFGFLPQQAGARRRLLETLSAPANAIVFYEAPHRVVESVTDMASAFGPQRTITIARELTKLFESIHVCVLGDAVAWLEGDPTRLKGEFVLIVDRAARTKETAAPEMARTIEILLREMPLKQAVKLATEITGARRNDVYALALALQETKARAKDV